MRTRVTLSVVIAVLALIAAACGSDDGDTAADGTKTIDIEMRDIAFSPDEITVPAGQEIELVFHNTGKIDHDAFIGDDMAQADHEEEMSADGGMHHGDSDEDAVTVEPGDTGTLRHTFEAGEEILIGCHQPGHYDAGMRIAVTTS